MANPSQTAIIGVGSKNILIKEVTVILADTKYSLTLENGLKSLLIRSRNKGSLKLDYGTTEYITINAGAVYMIENLNLTNKTLYLSSSKASDIIEVQQTY